MLNHSFNYLQQDWETLDNYWQQFLDSNNSELLKNIDQQLTRLARNSIIYPPEGHIFKALNGLKPQKIKVVILGQDPYHGENEANGLAFAVNKNVKIPPSLRNIFKELHLEFNSLSSQNPDSTLEGWKEQGVLLLNSTLTVIKDSANSLAKIGWHIITDTIIRQISQESHHCVFMLWGNHARAKKELITPQKHLILESAHPSPLSASRGFFGCNHFIQANKFLKENNLTQIDWFK